jgi:hypothetical protein
MLSAFFSIPVRHGRRTSLTSNGDPLVVGINA